MALNSWHVNLPPELRDPIWALARAGDTGIQETMVQLLRFALANPETLNYWRVMEKNK